MNILYVMRSYHIACIILHVPILCIEWHANSNMSDVQFSLFTNEMKLFSVKTTVYSMVFFYWTKRCKSYLGNPLLPHSFHHCKGVISRHVTPATEMEPQGPVGGKVRPTNQLIGSIRYV